MIVQTGSYRRIVVGEWFGTGAGSRRGSPAWARCWRADIQVEVGVGRALPVWRSSSTSRRSAGALPPRVALPGWSGTTRRCVRSPRRGARGRGGGEGEGLHVAQDMIERVTTYMNGVSPEMRPSMLIDLSGGKRIEVEALQGAVVRRGAACACRRR